MIAFYTLMGFGYIVLACLSSGNEALLYCVLAVQTLILIEAREANRKLSSKRDKR